MPEHFNTIPQWSSGKVAIEFRKSPFPVKYDALIVKWDQLLIPFLDCFNWKFISNYESIEHDNINIPQAISKLSSTEDAKTSPLIATYTNVVLENKTELMPINTKAMSAWRSKYPLNNNLIRVQPKYRDREFPAVVSKKFRWIWTHIFWEKILHNTGDQDWLSRYKIPMTLLW